MNEKFDLDIVSKEISSTIYDKGKKIFERGTTEIYNRKNDMSITKLDDKKFFISYKSYTYGSGINVYDQNIELFFEGNKLVRIYANCDCTAFPTYGECKHCASSVLTFFNKFSIEELLKKNNIAIEALKPKTDSIERLLEMIDYNANIVKEDKEEYELIPYFRLSNNHIYMSLKIGQINGKLYVVKNWIDLLTYFEQKYNMEYGKNLYIKHEIKNFSNKEVVEKILEILKNNYIFLREVQRQNSYQVRKDSKEVYIKMSEFTYFLNLLKDKIIFKTEIKDIEYQLEKLNYKLKFTVEQQQDFVKIKYYKVKSYLFSNNLYLFNDDKKIIYEINCETEANAKILNQMINEEIIIDKRNIYNFKYSILNRLNKIIELDKPLENSNRDILRIITDFNLEDDTLIVLHKIEENEEKDYPLEKFMKLNAISEEFSHMHEVDGNKVFEVHGIPNILKYMKYALPQVIKYSDDIEENQEFKNFDIDDDFDIDINLISEGTNLLIDFKASKFSEEELLDILKALKTNDKYLKLKNQKYINLEDEQMIKIKSIAQKLNVDFSKLIDTSFKVSSYNTLYLDVLLEDLNLKYYKEQKIAKMIEELKDFKNQKLEVSKDVKAKLRYYQQEGINWLNTLKEYQLNGILADDMGLGKTLQVIALLSSCKLKKPSIVIAPTSLVYNWESEINKFNPKLKYKLISGNKDDREEQIKNVEDELLITSYELIRRDIDLYKDYEFSYVILDEGQNIKNKNSQSAKAIKVLKGDHNLVLTGTPIENKLEELWSIFDFLMPNYLGNHTEFKKKYENPISKFQDKEALTQLQKRVKPFILRRLKKDVLKELPEKQEKVVYMEMLPSQRKVYDAQVLEVKKILSQTSDEQFKKKKIEILSMLTKMRQIVCNPGLVFENYEGDIIKEEILIENLLDLKASGHKTLVFSQFVSNFERLEQRMNENNISYYKIEGSTPKNIRHVLVDNFNEDNTDVFLISLKAGGTGLNIVGADTVIHYDPWWNTAVESQATDRAYRMGQKNNVLVYKYICKNTIEEKILKIQEEKKDLANNILEGESVTLSKMDKDDFLELFE